VANSKQKPVPEKSQRRPGKTKFSIPRREAPPIDGSYLDRLFADYDKQTKELESPLAEALPEAETPVLQQVTEISRLTPTDSGPLLPQADALPGEVSKNRSPEVTAPFPPQEVVPAEPEEAPVLSPETLSNLTAEDPQSLEELEAPPEVQQEQPRPAPFLQDNEPLLEGWKKRHRLSKGEVKVLRALISLCREASCDHCYVKIPQLMENAELKERQTQLVLRRLQGLGLIEKLADYSNADRMGTKYRVVFDSE